MSPDGELRGWGSRRGGEHKRTRSQFPHYTESELEENSNTSWFNCLFYVFLMFIYLRERASERVCVCVCVRARAGEGKRERIPSRLHAVSTETDTRLELTNRQIVTRGEIKSRTFNQLSHPGAPSLSLVEEAKSWQV